MRQPCYESPTPRPCFRASRCIYPRRFDINFHTYYAIVARVTRACIRCHNREWNPLNIERHCSSISPLCLPPPPPLWVIINVVINMQVWFFTSCSQATRNPILSIVTSREFCIKNYWTRKGYYSSFISFALSDWIIFLTWEESKITYCTVEYSGDSEMRCWEVCCVFGIFCSVTNALSRWP